LSNEGVQPLVMDVVEAALMKGIGALHATEASSHQTVEEVVRLLPMRDAGEAAILPFMLSWA
jgi:hypothetical protein